MALLAVAGVFSGCGQHPASDTASTTVAATAQGPVPEPTPSGEPSGPCDREHGAAALRISREFLRREIAPFTPTHPAATFGPRYTTIQMPGRPPPTPTYGWFIHYDVHVDQDLARSEAFDRLLPHIIVPPGARPVDCATPVPHEGPVMLPEERPVLAAAPPAVPTPGPPPPGMHLARPAPASIPFKPLSPTGVTGLPPSDAGQPGGPAPGPLAGPGLGRPPQANDPGQGTTANGAPPLVSLAIPQAMPVPGFHPAVVPVAGPGSPRRSELQQDEVLDRSFDTSVRVFVAVDGTATWL